MSHDLLLEWVSERGEGSWTQLRHAHDWLFAGRERPAFQTPGFTVGLLSTLGHMEMDWISQRWAASPPVITLLPSAGAHALLTGGRTRALMQSLERELENDHYLYPLPPLEQPLAPSAVLIPCEESAHIEALASRLDIRYEHSVSERLSELLPTLDGYLNLARSAPPPHGYGFQKLDAPTLAWRDEDNEDGPGLYRHEGYGGFIYQFRDRDGADHRVDMPLGIYAELRRLGDSLLKWFRHSVNGQLTVPLAAPLPALPARTAALCSGLAPKRQGKVLAYLNVPQRVAERIAQSLGQTLEIVDGRKTRGTASETRRGRDASAGSRSWGHSRRD